MASNYLPDKKKSNIDRLEKSLKDQRRKQAGVAFPSATKQGHLLIIRCDISHRTYDSNDRQAVRAGMRQLCDLFNKIDRDIIKIDEITSEGDLRSVPLSVFDFSLR